MKALVGLCRELGVATVAENVEDEASLDFIRACGVQYAQSYLFGVLSHDIRVFARNIPAHLFRSRDQW